MNWYHIYKLKLKRSPTLLDNSHLNQQPHSLHCQFLNHHQNSTIHRLDLDHCEHLLVVGSVSSSCRSQPQQQQESKWELLQQQSWWWQLKQVLLKTKETKALSYLFSPWFVLLLLHLLNYFSGWYFKHLENVFPVFRASPVIFIVEVLEKNNVVVAV